MIEAEPGLSREDGTPEFDRFQPNLVVLRPFESDDVSISGSLMKSIERAPSIADIDEALWRARHKNGHDRERMPRIVYFI
jgi:hypothetical protein